MNIKKYNPKNSKKVFVADKNPHKTPYFAVFYVFMLWMKASCRPIIGLDGCLLKHCCKRQMLCAIRRDWKNQIFLVVPGIVKIGSKGTWTLMRLERMFYMLIKLDL